jgi:hypothetical protein
LIFILRNKEILARCKLYLDGLDFAKPIEVSIREFKSRRNSPQNRLYWSTVNGIAERMGKNPDVLHEYFKQLFIGYDEEEIGGTIVKHGLSTTTLDVHEFSDYVTKVQQWEVENLGGYV